MIQIHAYDMDIKEEDVSVTWLSDPPTLLSITDQDGLVPNDDRHFYNITMAADLEMNENYLLEIKYVGKLNTDLDGFYRSSYLGLDGSTK